MTKKKTFMSFALAICLFVPAMLMLSACGHTHTFTDDNDFDCNTCGYVRTPENNTLTFSVQNRTYNGSAQGLVSGTDFTIKGNATVVYKAKDALDNTYTEEAPKDAGNYTAKVTFGGNALYKEISGTQDFEIAQKQLSNIAVEKIFDEKLTATQKLTAQNGVVNDETVYITLTAQADSSNGTQLNAGANKTITNATLSSTNYKLPEISEMSLNVTKRTVSLRLRTENQFKELYVDTSLPTISTFVDYINVVNGSDYLPSYTTIWQKLETKIENNQPVANWVAVEQNQIIKSAGTYKLSLVCEDTANYTFAKQYELVFQVQNKTTIAPTDTISVNAGETKTVFVKFDTKKFYSVGTNLPSDATVELYVKSAKGYVLFDEKLANTNTMMLSGEYKVVVTAKTAIPSKAIFEDATFAGTYDSTLAIGENKKSVSGVAGKWLTFTLTQEVRCKISYDITSATVFYSDDYGLSIEPCISNETIADTERVQDGEIIVYVYCTQDLANATITLTEVTE